MTKSLNSGKGKEVIRKNDWISRQVLVKYSSLYDVKPF